jgi:hypothetical protein
MTTKNTFGLIQRNEQPYRTSQHRLTIEHRSRRRKCLIPLFPFGFGRLRHTRPPCNSRISVLMQQRSKLVSRRKMTTNDIYIGVLSDEQPHVLALSSFYSNPAAQRTCNSRTIVSTSLRGHAQFVACFFLDSFIRNNRKSEAHESTHNLIFSGHKTNPID